MVSASDLNALSCYTLNIPQDEPYFLEHVPFRSCLYHLQSFNPKLSVECEKEKNFYLSQHGVVTKMFEYWPKASAVDGERLYMLIIILHSNFRYISSLQMSIMNTNLLVFGTLRRMCFIFIILCHFDTPKIDGVTAMFGSICQVTSWPWYLTHQHENILILRYFLDKYTMQK